MRPAKFDKRYRRGADRAKVSGDTRSMFVSMAVARGPVHHAQHLRATGDEKAPDQQRCEREKDDASATTMGNVRRSPSKARRASVSRTANLTKADYAPAAKRFVRWRRKNWKPPKRKIKRIWVR